MPPSTDCWPTSWLPLLDGGSPQRLLPIILIPGGLLPQTRLGLFLGTRA